MAVVSSGPIRLGADVGATFGDSAPYSMGEYYRGGALVPASIPYTVTAYEGPAYGWDGSNYSYVWTVWSDGAVAIVWAYQNIYGGQNGGGSPGPGGFSSISIGGYTYYQGAYQTTVDVKGTVLWYEYAVGRYYYYTAYETVNTNIPSSGQISLTQFYGARKT